MGIATGCHDGKATPKLLEVKCPHCGDVVEVFEKEGLITADEKCDGCGYVIEAGVSVQQLQRA